MTRENNIHVYNEIGKLKTVLLHRPGSEIENLIPEYMSRLLFDEIAYLKQARIEHDEFANILKSNGVEVLYLTDLMAEVLEKPSIKEKFIDEFMTEGHIISNNLREALSEYFTELSTKDFIDSIIAGVRTKEIKYLKNKNLDDLARESDGYPFFLDPIPNLYFQRDPFSSMGSGITLNVMSKLTRNRETIFAKYIFDNHPKFSRVPRWYDRNQTYPIEGGDILILSPKVVAIGISERTTAHAIEETAKNLFNSHESFETVLAFNIPKIRAYMHLDTVFTMVDYNKFTIHPGIEEPLEIFSLHKNGDNSIHIEHEKKQLSDILKKYLNLSDVTLIRCGGGDFIYSGREQWNDGSNTLAIAPGVVICYDRNYVTNRALREHGVEVLEMPSYELSRGRGGPRCMSMPIVREDVKL